MIRANGETVLVYNMNNDKGRKLRFLLVKLGIKIKVVSPDEYGMPIGILAGMKDVELEDPNAEVKDFQEEMIVMKGFSNHRLDDLLKGMRKDKIDRIACKAILTPTNCRWNSWQLYQELRKEHEAMNGQNA